MTIQRNIKGEVTENVRRTIEDLDVAIIALRAELGRIKDESGRANIRIAQQASDIAGLIGARSQPVIGQDTADPSLPGQIGGGTVTSLSAGSGITLTPNPITSTGSIGITTPVPSGAWTSWTPTWTNVTIGNAVVTAAYFQAGKFVLARLNAVFGTTTTFGGPVISFSLPVTSISYPGTAGKQKLGFGVGYAKSSTGNAYNLDVDWNSTTTAILRALDSAGANPFQVNCTATVPATWANTDEFDLGFFYQAA